MPKKKQHPYAAAAKSLWRILRPHRKWYFAAAFLTLALTGLGLLQASATAQLIDSTAAYGWRAALPSAAAFTLLIGIGAALRYACGSCTARLEALASRDLKRQVSGALLDARYPAVAGLRAGDALSTVNTDTEAVCGFIGGDLIGLFSQAAMLLGAAVYLLIANPLLAVVTFLYTPIGMCCTLALNRRMNRFYPVRADRLGDALSVAEQVLSQIPVVKSFLMEDKIRQRIHTAYDEVCRTEMQISVPNALIQAACSSTAQIPRFLYLAFAGYLVINGHATVGALIAMYDLLNFIIAPTVYFPFLLNGLNRSVASINRVSQLTEMPREEAPSALRRTAGGPSIRAKGVTFGYEPERPVLREWSFSQEGPGIVALCGGSGCGKTTLLDLLAGLYRPDAGSIELAGRVSVMAQDSFLFTDTLLNNVRMAREDANDAEVLSALELAGADAFALELPDGVNTLLGDGGTELSGGQRQRISLARTILSGAEIWLLDEPTSALDPETERRILDTLRRMAGEKLILIAAHRGSLVALADRVVRLSGGREAA